MNQVYLLEESTKTVVPDTFKTLIQNVLQNRGSMLKTDKSVLETFSLDNDYIVCVLCTVALECGFRVDDSSSCEFDVREMREFTNLGKWRDTVKKIYQVELRLSQLHYYSFMLLVVPVFGSSVIINFLTLKNGVAAWSNADCMVPSHWLSLFEKTVAERFNNLPKLARCCRNFFLREKDIALNVEKKINPSLLGIPEELKFHIFKKLGPKDFVHVTTCCKSLTRFLNSTAYWKYRLKKDYNTESATPMDDYVAKFCSSKIVTPGYPDFSEEFFPMVLNTRATSSTTLNSLMPPYL